MQTPIEHCKPAAPPPLLPQKAALLLSPWREQYRLVYYLIFIFTFCVCEPEIIFFSLDLKSFYHYYCLNGQTHLNKPLDNGDYPRLTPVAFEDFFKETRMEDLSEAMMNLGA